MKRVNRKLALAESRKRHELVRDFVLAHGGTHVRTDEVGPGVVLRAMVHHEYEMPTRAGALRVFLCVDDDGYLSVLCRFHDVDAARSLLRGTTWWSWFNPYSGKFNVQGVGVQHGDTAESVFDTWHRMMEAVLPAPAEVSHG